MTVVDCPVRGNEAYTTTV